MYQYYCQLMDMIRRQYTGMTCYCLHIRRHRSGTCGDGDLNVSRFQTKTTDNKFIHDPLSESSSPSEQEQRFSLSDNKKTTSAPNAPSTTMRSHGNEHIGHVAAGRFRPVEDTRTACRDYVSREVAVTPNTRHKRMQRMTTTKIHMIHMRSRMYGPCCPMWCSYQHCVVFGTANAHRTMAVQRGMADNWCSRCDGANVCYGLNCVAWVGLSTTSVPHRADSIRYSTQYWKGRL